MGAGWATTWKSDGKQEVVLVPGIPLSTDLRLNCTAGPHERRGGGPPGVSARLEWKGGCRI